MGARRKLLLVDDDDMMRRSMRLALEQDGWQVSEAENGRLALARLTEVHPDIIMLDLMMPVMDGFGFLHALRADPRFRELPVIVATARTLDENERRDLAETAQQVIEKSAHTRHELISLIGDQIQELIARRAAATS